MSEVAEVWKHIDKHREQISNIEKENYGLSSRMTVLETGFQTLSNSNAQGQAKIETMLACLQSEVSKLNADKNINEGYKLAKKEHHNFLKWVVGIGLTLIASGVIVINFIPKQI